jgi:hypothetical protein
MTSLKESQWDKNFHFSMSSRPAVGVKRPGREAKHSPPASAKVKKTWVYTFTAPCTFMS